MIRGALMCWLLVPCAAGAQDFCDNDRIPPGTPLAEFEIHGDGTVTHKRTSLMWSRCALGQAGPLCAGAPTPLPWNLALQAADDSSLGGHDDWRLPTRAELASIVERCRFAPAQNTMVFPIAPSVFWTSTPAADAPGLAWGVTFDTGAAMPVAQNHGAYVRLVRTGERTYAVGDIGPAGGVIVHDKGDRADGWRYLEAAPKAWSGAPDPWVTWGCSGVSVGTTATAIGAGAAATAALLAAGCSEPAQIAAAAVINGYDDWFLPSRDELMAMHDALAIGTNFLSDHGLQPMSYASSSELDATGAIGVDFAGGGSEVLVSKSLATLVVRPVRRF